MIMNTNDAINRDEMLTVKEAAAISGSSVPRFYSDRNKELLGFHEAKEGTWFISVGSLIDAGFLHPDGTPANPSRPRGMGKKDKSAMMLKDTSEQLDEVREARDFAEQELADKSNEINALKKENERLSTILEERTKQLESAQQQVVLIAKAFAPTEK